MQVYGQDIGGSKSGIFYGGDGKLLACQLLAVLVIPAWVVVNTTALFWTLRRFDMLRVSVEEEVVGMDRVSCPVFMLARMPVPQPVAQLYSQSVGHLGSHSVRGGGRRPGQGGLTPQPACTLLAPAFMLAPYAA